MKHERRDHQPSNEVSVRDFTHQGHCTKCDDHKPGHASSVLENAARSQGDCPNGIC